MEISLEPVIIKNGRVFYPANLDETSIGEMTREGGGKEGNLCFQGITFPLYRGPTIDELVNLTAEENKKTFLIEIEKEFADIVKGLEANFSKDITNFDENLKLISLIVYDVMPHFVSAFRDAKLKKTIKGKSKREGVTEEFISNILPYINKEKYESYIVKASGLCLGEGAKQLSDIEGLLKSTPTSNCWSSILDKIGKDPVEKVSNERGRIDQIVHEIYRKAERKNPEFNENTGTDKLFLLHRGDLFILENGKDPKDKLTLAIKGKKYHPADKCNIFLESMLMYFAKERIRAKQKERFKEVIERTREMLNSESVKKSALTLYFADLDNFEIEKFGFIKNNYKDATNRAYYTLYVRIPEYALKNRRDEIYLFPSARVGINLYYHANKNGFEVQTPFVLDSYSHPFLRGNGAGQGICLGSYRWSGKNTTEKAIEALLIGEKVLLKGWIIGNNDFGMDYGNPYRRLDNNNFGNHKISENDKRIRNGEVEITNI